MSCRPASGPARRPNGCSAFAPRTLPPRILLLLGALLLAFGLDLPAANPPPVTDPAPATPATEVDVRRDAVVEAVAKVLPAVVNVSSRTWERRGSADPFDRMIEEYFGYRRAPRASYSRGSGVIIDPEGYVLTNVHVVGDSDDVSVQLADTEESLPAERVALSEAKDVALLRIKAPAGRRFRAVKLARDDDLLLGETVLALGNPFGLGGSVSRGILSSKSRRAAGEEPEGGRLEWRDWLQTDAAINPGNSGGPLVNLRGELIGINVAVLSPEGGAQGIGFAIPIRRVNEALAETLSGESVEGLWFGARLKPGLRQLTVRSVQPGSPAARAGLRAGDLVLEIDGQGVPGLIELNRRLVAAGTGRDLRLGIQREGERNRRTLTLRLQEETEFFNLDLIRQRLGLSLRPTREGCVISEVEVGGPASARRLEKGMLVLAFDGQPAADVVAFAKAVHGRSRGETIDLDVVFTRGWTRYRTTVAVAVRGPTNE